MHVTNSDLPENNARLTKWTLLAGIATWFIHQNTVYALGSLSCKWSWLSAKVLGIPALHLIEGLITLVALALMAYLIYLPWQAWRIFQSNKPQENPYMLEETEKDRRPMAAFIVMGLNFFFFLFILVSFVPIIVLKACVQS